MQCPTLGIGVSSRNDHVVEECSHQVEETYFELEKKNGEIEELDNQLQDWQKRRRDHVLNEMEILEARKLELAEELERVDSKLETFQSQLDDYGDGQVPKKKKNKSKVTKFFNRNKENLKSTMQKVKSKTRASSTSTAMIV